MVKRIILAMLLFVAFPALAAVETTTITFTVIMPSGATATSGTVYATLSSSGETPDGASTSVVAARTSATIASNGAVSIALVPNDAITPEGTYYIFNYDVRTPSLSSWKENRTVATTPDPGLISDTTLLDAAPGIAAPVSRIQDEATSLTRRSTLNMTGGGVTCTDNSANGRTDCTIPSVPSGVVNVRDYGAVGNGSTDDGPSIQSAIDAAGSSGSEVYLPPGTFVVGDCLFVHSNTHLRGSGIDSTVIKKKADSFYPAGSSQFLNCVVGVGSSKNVGYTALNPGASVTFSDFTVDGNFSNQANIAYQYGFGLSVSPSYAGGSSGGCVDGVTISRVKVINTANDGIRIHSARNVLISDSIVYNCGQGTVGQSLNGISVYSADSGWGKNIVIAHNRVSKIADGGGGECISTKSVSAVTIVGNDLSDCDYGIEANSNVWATDVTSYGYAVAGNTIHDLHSGGGVGIDIIPTLDRTIYGVTVTGNSIYNSKGIGINVGYSYDVSVSGNSIVGSNTQAITNHNAAVSLVAVTGLSVSGNSIHMNNPIDTVSGIELNQSVEGSVSANIVRNDKATNTAGRAGVLIKGGLGSERILVTGNRIIGFDRGVAFSTGSSVNTSIANYATNSITAPFLDSTGDNFNFGDVGSGELIVPESLTAGAITATTLRASAGSTSTAGQAVWAKASTSCATACTALLGSGGSCSDSVPLDGTNTPLGNCSSTTGLRLCECY